MEGNEIRALVEEKFRDAILEQHDFRGDDTLVMERSVLHEVLAFLRSDPRLEFDLLVDVCGVDLSGLGGDTRFQVVYHLFSTRHHHRLRLKFPVPEDDPVVDSVTDIWVGANWFERETYDMFGILFRNHPNLRRILTHEEFDAHPLRKDYPVNRRPALKPVPADILTPRPFKG